MSWFQKLLGKKPNSPSTASDGSNSSSNVSSGTSSGRPSNAPPPLPPRRSSTIVTRPSSGTISSGSSAINYNANSTLDSRGLLIEQLMHDYIKLGELPAQAKLNQLLEICMNPNTSTTGHAASAASFQHTHHHTASLPNITTTFTHSSHQSPSPSPPFGGRSTTSIDLGATFEESAKRNPHLAGFLSTAGSRLADRVGALTGVVGSNLATQQHRYGSIAANTPLNAALADKQAARWLNLLALFSPFPTVTASTGMADPYAARLLELLRVLAYKDEKRIACLNASRLSTVLLQCIHALAEIHPSTLEHMMTLERVQANSGGNLDVESEVRDIKPRTRQRHGGPQSPSQSDSNSNSSDEDPSESELSSRNSGEEGSGSDFELETAEDHEVAVAAAAAAASIAASSTAAQPASSGGHVASPHPRNAAEYAKLPLVERIQHLQSLFAHFLGSIAHAIPTTMELVRSNSLIMLIRMCVGGNYQSSARAASPAQPDSATSSVIAMSSSFVPPPLLTTRKGSIEQKDGGGSDSKLDTADDEQDAIESHSVPQLLHHAQVLSLSLLLKLLTSRPCLDVKVCVYLSKSSALKLLLSLLHSHDSIMRHTPSTFIDLIQSLIQVLQDSSQAQSQQAGALSYNLFDEFTSLHGYDLLLRTTLWIRSLYLQADAERINNKQPPSASPMAKFADEDLLTIQDNPFLHPQSLYPVLPPIASKHFLAHSPQDRCQELQTCLTRLLELLHSLIFISPHQLKAHSKDEIQNRLLLNRCDSDSPVDEHTLSPSSADHMLHPSSQELRIKNLDGIKLILFIFMKCPIVFVRQEILNRMLLIYSSHPENIWLLHSLHPITYFIEIIPHLSISRKKMEKLLGTTLTEDALQQSSGTHLQKLIWRLLEYIVNVSGVVPFQEITTIGLILRIRSPAEIVNSHTLTRPQSLSAGSSATTTSGQVTPPKTPMLASSQRRTSLISFEHHPSILQLSSLRTFLQYPDDGASEDAEQMGGGVVYGNGDEIYLDSIATRMTLIKFQEFIEENSMFREVFRETEILAILIQHLVQLATYLDALAQRENANATKGGEIYTPNPKLEEILRLKPLLLDISTFELALKTIHIFLVNSTENMRLFREFGGSSALFSLVEHLPYRCSSLELIGVQIDAANVGELLETLQKGAGKKMDPRLQVDLLGTLTRMLQIGSNQAQLSATTVAPSGGAGLTLLTSDTSPNASLTKIKDTYRTLGGFEVIFSLLSRMDSIFTPDSEIKDTTTPAATNNHNQWLLLSSILCIIGLSIQGHPRNREYVWSYSKKNHTWKVLAYTIKLSGVLKTRYAANVVQAMMNLATETPQPPETKLQPLIRAIPTATQPWCLFYPLPDELENVMTPASNIWPVIHSPDAILAFLRILVDCRIDLQVSGLTSLYALVAHSSHPSVPAAGLRNLDTMSYGGEGGIGVLTYFLAKFGEFVRLRPTERSLEEKAYEEKEVEDEASTIYAALSHTNHSFTVSQVTSFLHQRSFLCQAIIESLASFRISPAELKTLVVQFHKRQSKEEIRRQELKKEPSPQPDREVKKPLANLSPSVALYQFFLRLLHRSQWSTACNAGDFLEFDLRSTGAACLDVPSFSKNNSAAASGSVVGSSGWPHHGVFSFSCWLNIRHMCNEPVIGQPINNRSAVTPLLQLFEFTTGGDSSNLNCAQQHLWSAAILPTGYLLVSAGNIAPSSSSTTGSPWHTANLEQLEEKGPRQGQALFEKYHFEPKEWHHLTLMHEKNKGQNRMLLSLYVDGAFVQQVQVQCAPTSVAQQSSVMTARGYIGVPPVADRSSLVPSNLVWWMNGIYFWNGFPSSHEISVMYRRGPGYVGSFAPANVLAGAKVANNSTNINTGPNLTKGNSQLNLTGSNSPPQVSTVPISSSSPNKKDVKGQNDAFAAKMESERTLLTARIAVDSTRMEEIIATSSGEKSAIVNTATPNSPLGPDVFDVDKLIFTFQAHHFWSLTDYHANQASNGDSKGLVELDTDEATFQTVVMYAEYNDPGLVLLNTCAHFPPPNTALRQQPTGFPVAYLHGGGVSIIRPLSLLHSLRRIGGVTNILALLAPSQCEVNSSADLLVLLSILFTILHSSVGHMKDMIGCGGYTLLSHLLQQHRRFLTADTLQLLACCVRGCGQELWRLVRDWNMLTIGPTPIVSLLPSYMRPQDALNLTSNLEVFRIPLICCEEYNNWSYLWTYLPSNSIKDEKGLLINIVALDYFLMNAELWMDSDSALQQSLFDHIRSFRLIEPKSDRMISAFQATYSKHYFTPNEFDINTALRQLLVTLHKQSILFNWANEVLPGTMDEDQVDTKNSIASGIDRQDSSDASPPLVSLTLYQPPATIIPPLLPSQILDVRMPLPYRNSSQALHILSDWIRRGYLPSQRFQLDLQEGPLRQRKKMRLQEEFYLHYKIHVPRLAKALPVLKSKHEGVSQHSLISSKVEDLEPSRPVSPIISYESNEVSTTQTDEPSTSSTTRAAVTTAAPSSVTEMHDAPETSELALHSRSSSNAAMSPPRVRRYPTATDFVDSINAANMSGGKLSVIDDAKRQLLEELPQLPLSTLTQITAHANSISHSHGTGADGEGSSSKPRRGHSGARRYSGTAATILQKIQHAESDSIASETVSSIGENLNDAMSAIAESPLSSASEDTTTFMPEGSNLDDSDSSESEDEEATPTAGTSPRRSFPISDSASQLPILPSSPSSTVSDSILAASEGDDDITQLMRREGLTRARSLATGGSLATKKTAIPSTTESTAMSTNTSPSPVATTNTAPSPRTSIIETDNGGEPIPVVLDHYEKILRMLEPGDDVLPGGLYSCSRVIGLDKVSAVVVLCTHNLYVIDHFGFSPDGLLISIDPKTADVCANEAQFHVEVTARPVSVPWQSDDEFHRDSPIAMTTPIVPPLSPEDIVLHVSKVTKSNADELSAVYKSKEKNTQSTVPTPATFGPPVSEPDDPLTDTLGEEDNNSVHKLAYTSLRELHKRRYSLMALGLEFFAYDGVTMLLVFESPEERDQIHIKIISVLNAEVSINNVHNAGTGLPTNSLDLGLSMPGPGLSVPSHARLRSWRKGVCEKWQRGEISNFAYLMFLNTFAGRSYNDFTQYPVFPWILNDYTSTTLALDDERIYRDLSKPMGAIGEERAKLFQARYANWEDPTGTIPSFHYGTHYSSAATVLYYLIRLEPFTQYNLLLQGGKFDHADRLFFDLGHTWTSASSQGGLSDVKELIPEFFYLPDFLNNNNRFDLGEHQRGGYVDDVKLPPWAMGDPRIFIRLHRKALESPYVSAHLHEWIDLIFGFKQRGKAATKAQNVFYYLTYEDVVDVNAISDPLEKEATIAQIGNFGQTPSQIFKHAHPPRQPISSQQRVTISSHPQLLHPVQQINAPLVQLSHPVGCLYWSTKQDKLFALDSCKTVIPGSFSKYMSWNHSDYSLRFHILQTSPRHRILDEVVAIHEGMHDGQITIATSTDDGQCFLTGGVDGLVKVWRLHPEYKHKQLILSRTLSAHLSPITAIVHAWSYSLLVTASQDGQVLFHDMNKLSLQRKLPIHPYHVSAIAIDPLRGDVITCSGPNIYVWDVNGGLVSEYLGSVAPSETIESVVWSQGAEGSWVEPNILTGHRDGSIRIWRLLYPTSSLEPLSPELFSPMSGSPTMPASGAPPTHRPRESSGHTLNASPTTTTSDGTRTTRADSYPSRGSSDKSSSSTSRPTASLGVGFLTLDLCHRLEVVHSSPVTYLHTSPGDWKRFWSGDRSGRVYSWQISSDEHWLKDAEAKNCQGCQIKFSVLERRHHCRECGFVFCSRCSSHRIPLEHLGFSQSVRVCDACYIKVTNNLHAATASNATTPISPTAAAAATSNNLSFTQSVNIQTAGVLAAIRARGMK